MLDLSPETPPLVLAHQLAGRAGCAEILRVTADRNDVDTDGVVRSTDNGSVPIRQVTPWALGHGPWGARRIEDNVLVVDVDDVIDHVRSTVDLDGGGVGPAVEDMLGPLVRRATFTILVAAKLNPGRLVRIVRRQQGLVAFRGRWSHGADAGGSVVVAEAPDQAHSDPTEPPAGFTATAFVTVFNEQDVLGSVLDDLAAEGVQSYVLDNWSTDDSWDITSERLGDAVVGAERWPPDGPVEHFDLKASLARIEDVSRELPSDWFLKHDADEIRRAPWPDVTLAQGLWMAQAAGYNVVDFTVMNYQPIDNGFAREHDLWDYFDHFAFGRKPGHFRQLKAWRNFGQEITYAGSGSHRVAFPGARVHPYKFELHHYPIRSQDHGIRKVLAERQERYLPAARARGWHSHYDGITAETNFLSDPDDLWSRAPRHWDALVLERLSGAGLPRDG